MLNNKYIYDGEVKSKHVLFGQCALARNGLTTQNGVVLDLLTEYEEVDGISVSIAMYYYKSNIDYVNYVSPMFTNELILLPTPERAIVEYILFEKWCDEGTLIEALKTYEGRENVFNFPLLYEVAEFYGLKKEVLDYWISEAREDPGY